MADIEPIERGKNEFTMQWRITTTEKESLPFVSGNKSISTEEEVLYLAENAFYQARLWGKYL